MQQHVRRFDQPACCSTSSQVHRQGNAPEHMGGALPMLLTHLSPLNIDALCVPAAGQKSGMQTSRLAVTMLWAAVALLAGALAGVLVYIYGHKVGSRVG